MIALEDTRVQDCKGFDFRTIRKFFLFAATVLLLASIAVGDLDADDIYPNCTITAIDTSSGLVTSKETSTGKIFYFQVTDAAQLEHLRIHQGIWIHNGQVSFDGAKPCACKVVSSPTEVTGGSNSVPVNAGPASSATKPWPEASTNAAGVSAVPGKGSQTGAAPQTSPVTTNQSRSPVISKAPGSAEGSDILVLRDGKRKSGSLAACGISTCLMGTSVIPRQNIQWIGLNLSQKLQAAPPPPKSSTTDELHLADGSIHPGDVLGIRAASVEVAGQSYDRKNVKWVHLVLVSANQKPTGFEDQTPDSGNASNTGNPPPPPPPGGSAPPAAPTGGDPSSSRTPRSAHDVVKACPVDKPLGGRIEVDSDWNNIGCRGSRRAILRFPLIPSGVNGAPWHMQLWGGFTAPEVHYELSTGGCSGVYQADIRSTCNAPNGRDTADVTLGEGGGPGGFIPVPDADGFLNFYPVKPEIAASTLLYHETGGGGQRGTFTPLECPVPRSGGSGASGGWSFDFGGLDIRAADPGCLARLTDSDYGRPFFACVQPTECTKPAGAALQRDCMLHAERHAVIPFEGEEHWQSPKASDPHYSGVLSAKIHWKICCGCGEAAAPPEPETSCKDTSQYQAQVDRLANISRCYREDLKNKKAEFQHFWSQAQMFRSDFDLVVRSCDEFNLAKTLLSYLVGKGEIDTVKDFVLLEAVLEKIVTQDPSAVLNFSNLEVELGGQAISVDVALLWETMMKIREAVQTVGEAGSVEGKGTRLSNCAGTPMVSDLVWQGAMDYLRNLKAATEMMPELQKLTGDIEHTDEDRWKAENDLYQACLQYAKCKGLPPNCTPPPDGPTAPAPGKCIRPKGPPGDSSDPQ